MKCSINLNLSSNNSVDVMYDEINDKYEINLYINQESNLEEFFKRENFDNLLRDSLSHYNSDDEEMFKYSIEGIKLILKDNFPILDNSDIIVYPEDEIDKFIDNNPCLKDKQLIVNGEFDINHDSLDPLLKYFGNHKNYYVLINGNTKYVTIEEYEKTVLAIDEIVNKIKKYNLSQLEQIMYAYDLVRDRIYKSEDENEDLSVSRDISSALLGNKIVCVGYSIIFEKVLDNLGIRSKMITLHRKNTNAGHRRNVVYVDDSKYGINGAYFFDTTWDSKKVSGDSSYLDSYRFFCRNKKQIYKYDKVNYEDLTLEGLEDLPTKFENIILKEGLGKVPKKMIKLINFLSNLVDGEDLINVFMFIDIPEVPEFLRFKYSKDELIDKVNYYYDLINSNSIGIDKLTELLFNVRKIEYYENPSKYPFSIDDFERTIVDEGIMNPKERFLRAIFGDSNESFREFERTVNDMELEKMIEQVRLSKALREFYESKKHK